MGFYSISFVIFCVKIEASQRQLSECDLAGNWRGSAKHCQENKIFLLAEKYFPHALHLEISPNKIFLWIDLHSPEVTFDLNILEILIIMSLKYGLIGK